MSNQINRRSWLRASALMTAGLFTTSTNTLSARPIRSWQKSRTIEHQWSQLMEPAKIKARLYLNENAFGPSEKVRLAVIDGSSVGNRYGHEDAAQLIKMIAAKEGVTEDSILLGPGSTDLLEKAAMVQFLYEKGNIVSADPTYTTIASTAQAFGAESRIIPLTKDWAHDLEAMEAAVDQQTRLVYVCNPNNPTATVTPNAELRAFCERVSEQAPVFIDEAYLEFLDDPEKSSMVDLVRRGKDVIISRTFSKIHGLAGLRIGYIVAQPSMIQKFDWMVKRNYGMCITSLKAAQLSLQDTTFHENSRLWTTAAREKLYLDLTAIGLDYIPSCTNFVLFPISMDGKQFMDKMYEQGIQIKSFQINEQSYCRVSVGKPEEMDFFVNTLKNILS